MTLPSIILGLLIASIPACIFNFFINGKFRKLIILNLFSWIGFWISQFIAMQKGWTFLKVGPLNLGVDLIGAIVLTALGFWLTNFKSEPKKVR